jgi:ATP-dependent DNA helicase DinG
MGAAGRDEAVDAFKRDGGVLVASSLERGVDLIGDLCRVVIVAKVPYPNMGDRRTSARMRLPGGRSWYATHTARSIVQMTGRGVRAHDDHATTYIFDSQFQKFWGQWSKLLPRWWRDAVEVVNPRSL